jgi:hypothetical protein
MLAGAAEGAVYTGMLTEVAQCLRHERRGRAISYFSAVMRAGLVLAGVELVDLVGYDRAWLTLGVLAVLAVAGCLPAKPRHRESDQDEVPAGTPAVVVVGASANGRHIVSRVHPQSCGVTEPSGVPAAGLSRREETRVAVNEMVTIYRQLTASRPGEFSANWRCRSCAA